MDYQNLLLDIKEGVLTVTINRESKLNALNRETLSELGNAVREALKDKKTRGIIITGSGTKAFIAGADISEFSGLSMDAGKKLAIEGHQIFNLIESSVKPVIAAINGYALGGGLELAMACHIRLASDSAKVGQPEIKLGLIPGYGGTQRLSKLAGKGRALEMILTGEMITAQEALVAGLVNYVIPHGELIAKAEELMQKIISGPPLAIASAIRAVNSAFNNNEDGFVIEIDEFKKCFETEDFKEGVSAFLEKRKPSFKGE
jgi:enoyl-CoA hydratase